MKSAILGQRRRRFLATLPVVPPLVVPPAGELARLVSMFMMSPSHSGVAWKGA
jgi:hypothetical protein